MYLTKRQRYLYPAVLILLPILLVCLRVDFLMILIMECLACFLLLCSHDFSSHVFFIFFLLSLFGFLISGDLFEEIFGREYWIRFGEAETLHARISILLSLLGLGIGYFILYYVFYKKEARRYPEEPAICQPKHSFRKAAMWLYILAYVFLMINTVNQIIFVKSYGYVAYYTSYTSILPTWLCKVGELTPIALCAFLATMPTKKQCRYILLSYALYACTAMFVGARGSLVYNLVFLACYMLFRNGRKNNDGEIWIHKSTIVAAVIFIPFMLVFFNLWDYIRLGKEIEFTSLVDSFIDFFVNIGASSKVIKYGYQYRNEIGESFRFFSFGDTLNYFKYGKLFNFSTPENIVPVHSARFALEGHSFDSYLSYLVMPDRFLAGEGLGSSYIAVLFADFGYLGIVIGSVLYGAVFALYKKIGGKNYLFTVILLYMYLSLIKAPRGSYDGFLSLVINITFWVAILGILVLARIFDIYEKKKRSVRHED